MLMIAQCPRCNEDVLLPAGVRPESRVRCPRCQEEYLLRDALGNLPPALIVVDGGPVDSSDWGQEGVGGSAYGGAYGGGLATAVDTALDTQLESAETTGPAAAPGSTAPRPLVKTSPRRKPKPKSAVMEGVKIVLGGAVGLFVAQLILWWGFHNDSFGIAPSLAKNNITRLLLPEALRKAPDAGGSTDQGAAATGGPTGAGQGTSSGAGFNNKVNWNDVVSGKGDSGTKGTSPARKPDGGNAASAPSGDQLVADIDPFGDNAKKKTADPFDLKPDQPTLLSVPNEPEIPLPSPEKPSSPAPTNPTAPMNPTPPTTNPPNADSPAAASPVKGLAVRPTAELAQSLAQARAAQEKLAAVDRSNRDELRSAAESLYKSATAMAVAATAADGQDAEYAANATAAEEFTRKLVGDAFQARLVDVLSPPILDAEPTESPPGIVLQGVVTSMKTQGEMSLATIKLATKDERSVSVVRKGEFPEGFVTDAKVVVLGVVVHDPVSSLEGYADEPTTVVYAGLSVVPTAPAAP